MPSWLLQHFLNPSFVLAGTALVASPIIIHLINRLRYRRVRFAAMEFLLASQQRNRRRVLLEQLILLLLRILLVLGLMLLIGAVWVLIWGEVAPPPDGSHHILGLSVSNYVGKLVYVTAMFCLMFLCGSVQLSGCCQHWCDVEMPDPNAHISHDHGRGSDSQGHNDSQGHSDPGHAHTSH